MPLSSQLRFRFTLLLPLTLFVAGSLAGCAQEDCPPGEEQGTEQNASATVPRHVMLLGFRQGATFDWLPATVKQEFLQPAQPGPNGKGPSKIRQGKIDVLFSLRGQMFVFVPLPNRDCSRTPEDELNEALNKIGVPDDQREAILMSYLLPTEAATLFKEIRNVVAAEEKIFVDPANGFFEIKQADAATLSLNAFASMKTVLDNKETADSPMANSKIDVEVSLQQITKLVAKRLSARCEDPILLTYAGRISQDQLVNFGERANPYVPTNGKDCVTPDVVCTYPLSNPLTIQKYDETKASVGLYSVQECACREKKWACSSINYASAYRAKQRGAGKWSWPLH